MKTYYIEARLADGTLVETAQTNISVEESISFAIEELILTAWGITPVNKNRWKKDLGIHGVAEFEDTSINAHFYLEYAWDRSCVFTLREIKWAC